MNKALTREGLFRTIPDGTNETSLSGTRIERRSDQFFVFKGKRIGYVDTGIGCECSQMIAQEVSEGRMGIKAALEAITKLLEDEFPHLLTDFQQTSSTSPAPPPDPA